MRILVSAFLLACAAGAAYADTIDVRMVLEVYEPGQYMVLHRDTCGTRTGATDGLDEGLEIDWPPYGPNQSDARWIIGDAMTKLDLQAIPAGPPGECFTTHHLNYQLTRSDDTFRIRWTSMPEAIDSIVIDNFGASYGDLVHHVATHDVIPDSVSWVNPPPPGAQVSDFRVMVYYKKSLLPVREPVAPTRTSSVWPLPAGEAVRVDAQSTQIRVYDALGRCVMDVEHARSGMMPVAALPGGAYTMTAIVNGTLVRSAFIVAH